MEIRKSTADDVPAILEIFWSAKAYMAAHGNPTQWGGGYPGLPELLPETLPGATAMCSRRTEPLWGPFPSSSATSPPIRCC